MYKLHNYCFNTLIGMKFLSICLHIFAISCLSSSIYCLTNNTDNLQVNRTEPQFIPEEFTDNGRDRVAKEDVAIFLKIVSNLLQDLREEVTKSTMKEEGCQERILRSSDGASEVVIFKREDPEEITLTSLLYEETESWSACRRSCLTSRLRKCRLKNLCEVDILVEEANCYVPGSKCEEKVKRMFDGSKEKANKPIQQEGEKKEEKNVKEGEEEKLEVEEEKEQQYDNEEEEIEIKNVKPDTEKDYYYYTDKDYDNVFEIDNDDYSYTDSKKPDNVNHESDFWDVHTDDISGLPDDEINYLDEAHNIKDYDYEDFFPTEKTEGSSGKARPGTLIRHNDCGKSSISVPSRMFRIIGGREAIKDSWPWQVAILNRFKEIFCGGTLISSKWVLTAAHCVKKKLYVRVGEHDIRVPDGEIELKVEKTFKHPNFSYETIDSDIALLKLPKKVLNKASKRLRKACLPVLRETLPRKQTCIVLGWGKERESHIFGSDVLRYVKVPIAGKKVCRKTYKYPGITKNMFCAGVLRGGADACEGDSGGPLLCQGEDQSWVLHGVTSFGEGCGEENRFGVYVKVSNYVDWIEETITLN